MTSDRRNELQEVSEWWNTTRNDSAWWHSIAKAIVKSGPVPHHVAFVMDGNRRFAKAHQLGHVIHGHEKGFQQLAKILEWCQELGIREVTVYAFSIENFKRSSEEVDGLMKLADEKFAKLLAEREKLEEKQISFRFFGNIAMLSPSLRKHIAQIQLLTKDYQRGVVNVCMPYTSRDEMARAFELMRKGREKGLIEESQISEWLVSRCLDSRRGTEPNLLIRTSGEKRLSDFMLWQCSSSHVYFDDVLWPEFTFWHLCKALLSYQYHCSSIEEIKRRQDAPAPSEEERFAAQPFLDFVEDINNTLLQEYASYKD